jgi:1-acyl-sn-glycerol-3-phosphate acyltransferase
VALELGPSDVAVNWLPLYHDMGLIGSWWTSLYHGIPGVMLSPLSFLLRPERWLWAIHRFGGTISPAPTFAYDLCAHKIPDAALEGLDLSSWRAAMVGAEPVREEALEAFYRRFEPHGLRRQTLMPVYGMAETALGLTITPPGRGPVVDRVARRALAEDRRAVPVEEGAGEALAIVGCGRPLPGHEVRITDRDDPEVELPERAEGRILFRGPSTMEGYFRAPEATAAVRRGEWIDTGDLGYLAGGEIYVTGRLKDLIIKGGRNYHPQDLERAAQRVPGVRKGCVMAFDAPGPRGETMVLVAETREPPARHGAIRQAVDEAVADAVGIPPDRVVLVPPRVLPKTSSGKLQRRRARELYLEGRLGRRQRAGWQELLAVAVPSALRRLGQVRRAAGAVGRLLYTSWAILVTLGVLGPGALLMLLARRADPGRWRTARGGLRLWGRLLGLLPRVTGSPPARGAAVVISNHGSYLDALVLIMASERPMAFTSKSEVFDWPLAGSIMHHMEHVPVDRSTHEARLESSEEMRRRLRRGEAIQIFPEATFTPREGLRPFRLGAFLLAAETGAALVPVVLKGTRAVLRDGHRLLSWSPLEVEFLEPVEVPEGAAFSDLVRLRDSLRRALSEAAGEPLLEELNP